MVKLYLLMSPNLCFSMSFGTIENMIELPSGTARWYPLDDDRVLDLSEHFSHGAQKMAGLTIRYVNAGISWWVVCRNGVKTMSRGVGQDGDVRELQRSLHMQLVGAPLDPTLREDDQVFAALQTAATGKCVLLVIDDAWQLDQVQQLSCIDTSTPSRVLVTTRISQLVPGAPAEFSLGVLAPEDAVALMFEVTGRTRPNQQTAALTTHVYSTRSLRICNDQSAPTRKGRPSAIVSV